jgi:putative RNA 2'-phosphotransferase
VSSRITTRNGLPSAKTASESERARVTRSRSISLYPPSEPPELLYHGTASRFVDSIRAEGLHSGNRQHVHLSLDVTTATKVGQRHGKPVILVVRAREMSTAGHTFFLSANGVWLTERVPVEFITFPGG